MYRMNFDGYVVYDDADFQKLIADLKATTDDADAAYTALDVDLRAYFALLDFNNLYVIVRDKADVKAFVEDDVKGTVKGGDGLPGDEIEAAIDERFRGFTNFINDTTRRVDGNKPQYELVYGIDVDNGAGATARPLLATVLFMVRDIAAAMRTWQNDTLHPALTREHRRALEILKSAENVSGALGVTWPPDPIADASKIPAAVAAATPIAKTKHAGLLEFRRYAEAALTRTPDVEPDSVIKSFSVTASNLPTVAALRGHWIAMMGLSSWPRTANLLTIANHAGFVMAARVVYLLASGEETTDWTDKYPAPDKREIDIGVKPHYRGHRFQVEVDAVWGATERGEPMFHSLLAAPEPAVITVTGTTLNFSFEAT